MKYPLIVAAFMSASAASAATTAVELVIAGQGNNNVPTLTLTNTGDTGSITGFVLTIGSSAHNLDGVTNQSASAGVVASLDQGDTNTSGTTTSASNPLPANRFFTLIYSFTGFGSGSSFSFETDVDDNFANTLEDYRTTLLPGGSALVTFSGGQVDRFLFDLTPTTGPNQASYTYTASAAPVPLPAGLPLMLTALGGAAVLSRRKRS